jgi:hypothetical protein
MAKRPRLASRGAIGTDAVAVQRQPRSFTKTNDMPSTRYCSAPRERMIAARSLASAKPAKVAQRLSPTILNPDRQVRPNQLGSTVGTGTSMRQCRACVQNITRTIRRPNGTPVGSCCSRQCGRHRLPRMGGINHERCITASIPYLQTALSKLQTCQLTPTRDDPTICTRSAPSRVKKNEIFPTVQRGTQGAFSSSLISELERGCHVQRSSVQLLRSVLRGSPRS